MLSVVQTLLSNLCLRFSRKVGSLPYPETYTELAEGRRGTGQVAAKVGLVRGRLPKVTLEGDNAGASWCVLRILSCVRGRILECLLYTKRVHCRFIALVHRKEYRGYDKHRKCKRANYNKANA